MSLSFRQWLNLINEGHEEIRELLKHQFTNRGAPPLVFDELWDELISIQGWALERDKATDEQKAEMLMKLPEISRMSKLIWTPQPIVMQIAPTDLVKQSLDHLMNTDFGHIPHPEIPDSAHRVQQARQYVQQPLESVLPVVLIQEGGKYRILAGHHRIAAWMLKMAPENRDVRKWPKTSILAYVGKYH